MELPEEPLSTPLLVERIGSLLEGDPKAVQGLAEEIHASDMAEALLFLPIEQAAHVVQVLPFTQAVEIFDEDNFSTRAQVLAELDLDLATALCEGMSPDERADVFKQLSPELAEVLRPRLSREVAQNLSNLLRYPEESAGGIMTTEFVTLRPQWSVKEAIEHIRTVAAGVETVYYAYLVDGASGFLTGVVSLKELLLAKSDTPVVDIMFHEPKAVNTEADQEAVARLLARYDLLAVPVLNSRGQIVGIVTVDDVLDVLFEEQSEDIHKLGAVEPTEAPYLLTSVSEMIRKRAGWLVILFLGEIFTGTVLEHYDQLLKNAIYLVYFLPLIISSGGNSGSQSATLIVRAMATGEVLLSQWWQVFYRELLQGVFLGIILGTIGFLLAYLGYGNTFWVSLVVGITLLAVVMTGALSGSLLPMLLKRLGFDPAVSSTPFIASLVDVAGIIIYLKIASFLLDL